MKNYYDELDSNREKLLFSVSIGTESVNEIEDKRENAMDLSSVGDKKLSEDEVQYRLDSVDKILNDRKDEKEDELLKEKIARLDDLLARKEEREMNKQDINTKQKVIKR